jgi:hypothetical protein
MKPFYHNILKAINDYKNIIKRNFAAKERQVMLTKLGIKRFDIKNASEVKLHAIGLAIIQELEQNIRDIERQQSVNCYFGAEEFLQHLKKLLSDHVIADGMVINAAQKSSCALIKAIQLVEIAKHNLSDDIAGQIYTCARVIAKYGDREQKRMFYKLINGTGQIHLSLFFRQLQNLIS